MMGCTSFKSVILVNEADNSHVYHVYPDVSANVPGCADTGPGNTRAASENTARNRTSSSIPDSRRVDSRLIVLNPSCVTSRDASTSSTPVIQEERDGGSTPRSVDSDVINQHLPSCCGRELVQPYTPSYWDYFRSDAMYVLVHLNHTNAKTGLTPYETELKEQIQSWLGAYRNHNPKISLPTGDPNKSTFPLPIRTQENPDSLRHWVKQWVNFDVKIPKTGPWFRYQVEPIDLGDPDGIFQASLRPETEQCSPFDHSIKGHVVWQVLPKNAIAHDIMTLKQEAIAMRRCFRNDLDDPKRMERRRDTLLNYFVSKYELQRTDVQHFARWADAMEEGDRKFKALCL